jgi:hypothetical protein
MTLNEWFQVSGVEPETLSSGRSTASVTLNEQNPNFRLLWTLSDFVVFAHRGNTVWLESREDVLEVRRGTSLWKAVVEVRTAHGKKREKAETEADALLEELGVFVHRVFV